MRENSQDRRGGSEDLKKTPSILDISCLCRQILESSEAKHSQHPTNDFQSFQVQSKI